MWHRHSNRSERLQTQRYSNIERKERIEIEWTANGYVTIKNIRIVIKSRKCIRRNKKEGNKYKVNGK